MNLKSITILGGFSAALLALGSPAVPGNLSHAGPQDEFEWKGTIAKGKSLEIKGVNGDVIASGTAGNEVVVRASKHWRDSDPDEVTIEVVEHDDGVTICAVYPDRRSRNYCAPGRDGRMNVRNNDVQVDFTIALPAGVHFIGRTVNGDVEADNLGADVRAGTVNGSIDISTAGRAEASTVNGSISAEMGRSDWDDEAEFHTVNGGITLYLPEGTNVDLRAEVLNGDVTSDFPMTIQGRQRRWGPRKLRATIGRGGPELELKSVNGSIRILKSRSR